MDATCSAIQIFSGLLLDEELAKAVNVIPNENDSVNDIYTEMLEPINENILNFVKENPEYKNLELLKLSRKNVKTPLMTVVYSSTNHGRSLMLASTFKKIKIDEIESLNKDLIRSINRNKSVKINVNNDDIFNDEDNQLSNINLLENIDNNSLLPLELEEEINDNEKENIIKDQLKYLYEAPSKDKDKPLYLTFKEIFKLAQIIHESLFITYPKLNSIFDYFKSITKAFSYLDIPINWSPPSGALITQKYLKVKKVKVFISVGKGKKKTVILSQKLNEMDNKAQILALNPNVVHSLDSSLVILLLSKHNKNLHPLVTIHDCFITHPNNMLNLVETVQDEFINLFEKEKFLEKFHNDLLSILDSHNVVYKKEKNKIIFSLKESLESDLPVVKKFNITTEEVKQILKENKNLTKEQLILSSYLKKILKELSFLTPPKSGSLNLKEVKKSSYIIT